jgi:anti-sigma regulatory factor (Ser/Thr protein kinase)
MSGPAASDGGIAVAPGVQGLEAARLRLVGALAAMTPRPGPTAVYAVELVLEEYATNARRHGDAAQVHVVVHDRGPTIELEFSDDGKPFDPTAASLPAAPADLDAAEPGGLGLVLMAQVTSAWSYERDARHNRLRVFVDKGAEA